MFLRRSWFLSLLVALTLIGCGSTPNEYRSVAPSYSPPPPSPSSIYKAPIQSTNAVKDLSPQEFANNLSEKRALFDINTADCRADNGQLGIFVVGLGSQSVVKEKGILIGDRLISIKDRYPATTQELVYIIHRTTSNTSQPMVFERNGIKKAITVFPPTWIPNERQKEQADTAYKVEQDPCGRINRKPYK